MKNLPFVALSFVALLILSAHVDAQDAKLVGKWDVATTGAAGAPLGWIDFGSGGSTAAFHSVNGQTYSVKNVKQTQGRYSFNVFEMSVKFDSLVFSAKNRNTVIGFMLDGKSSTITNRKMSVVLTRKLPPASSR